MGLDITGLGSIFGFGSKVIDKLFPDKAEADRAKLRLIELQQAGEFKEIDAALEQSRQQTAINQEEAKSASLFVAGWRPAVGWVCVLALFAQFIGAPALTWLSLVADIPAPPAPPDWTQLTPILMGMLGLGWLRTQEKKAGVA